MADNSGIEWTHNTGNIWWGCTEVHKGCDNCYARVLDNRWDGNHWGNDRPRRAIKSIWKDFARWQKNAQANGEIKKVFVGSMMDIFEKPMPLADINGKPIYGKLGELAYISSPTKKFGYDELNTNDLRQIFFNQISKGMYPNLLFLMLTKRPSNINKYIPESWKINPPKNVMFGTSPVDQQTTNILIPQLLQVKGKLFLSVEPQLDRIDLYDFLNKSNSKAGSIINWVIVGGESGGHKRPFNPDWARSIRDTCKKHKVPFFMKQWDKIKSIPDDLMIREFPNVN